MSSAESAQGGVGLLNIDDPLSLEGIVDAVSAGHMPAGIYSDPAIHALERERLFSRSWQFLGHASEVPAPGDFVVRRILDDSFIVARQDDGEIAVMLNMCLHRGMQVCRAEAGHAAHFRCPYHAWTYRSDGSLAGLPFHEAAYGGEAGFPKSAARLHRPAQVAMHRGLIFACLDPATPPLLDCMGDFAFYLDLYVNQSEDGIELRGPQRWIIQSNWKIGAENFSGDSYHTPHTHASVVDIGLFLEPNAKKRKLGALYWAGAGGGTTYKLPTTDFDKNLEYIGYPRVMIDRMRARWIQAQRDMVGPAGFMVSASTLFPNLSLVHNWPRVREGEDVVPFISIRLWQPMGPTETEVYSWFAVDKGAPDQFKEDSYRAYLLCFGSSGMFEQDDVENWTSITSVSKGRMASRVLLDNSMGLSPSGGLLHPRIDGWPGPGRAIQGYGEYNQRELLGRWAQHISDPAPRATRHPG
jgi:phenylpropionate dioxygenase-like ring-hydroxylating dioxygenase large terminal subunit